MKIRVLLFAVARERAGVDALELDLPEGACVGDAVDAVLARHPVLRPLLPHLRLAVDEAFVRDTTRPLDEGATVALIPPVAGGAPPRVALTHDPLDPRALEALVAGPDRGGVVTFTGAVRDHTGEHAVTRLEYSAYESMALKVLGELLAEVEAEHPGVRLAVHHRLGVLDVGEAAVVVAASAPHRGPAFAACARLIERLKEDVPIFKKEVRGDGSIWVGMGP